MRFLKVIVVNRMPSFLVGRTLVRKTAMMFCAILVMHGNLRCHGQLPDVFGRSYETHDSLAKPNSNVTLVGELAEGQVRDQDPSDMVRELSWRPERFLVSCERPLEWRYDCLVRFPTPRESGDSVNDVVAIEWHMARDEQGEIVSAPALIVVHESGRSMTVGRTFALLLSRAGLHTFMVQMPGYGVRRNVDKPEPIADFVVRAKQAVADVRRARDAVAVLPLIKPQQIALQGTSLGGFIAATAAGIDGKFDSVFVMLAGGDIYDVIARGQKDAAGIRERLAAAGITGDELKEQLWQIEPNRVAKRLNPRRTWLFSAKNDTVVPLENAQTWAKAVGLEPDHHIILDADHYSGVVYIPTMVLKVRDAVLQGASQPHP